MTQQVIMSFLNSYEDLAQMAYMDSFYTQAMLLYELQLRGFGACETVNVNRKHMSMTLILAEFRLRRLPT